jgi:lipopolysaccharide transport system ATP-binding protein
MSNTVISIENVSKSYQLGTIGTGTFRGDLSRWWARQRGKPDPYQIIGQADHGNLRGETLWALKEINLQVHQGEVLGIIGRNGAGKSTLLKILSDVAAPTSGEVKIKGRIASLLEVGTGFHPEMTGRENVYMNGAILGMSRLEVRRKFDEIVDFAGIEQFIDTPVKRYSSGMYVRLGFAVAAHLEPEILIVDEVLAVGDAEFQKKCLGKMGNVADEGRTVLFVSHNLQSISILCPTTILLQEGRIATIDATSQVIAQYLFSESKESAEAVWTFDTAPGTSFVKLHAVRVLNEKNELTYDVNLDEPIVLNTEFWILRKTTMTVSFHLYSQQGICVFATGNFSDPNWASTEHEPGLYSCSCIIPSHFLNNGKHTLRIYLMRDDNASLIEVKIPEVVSFDAHDNGAGRGGFMRNWIGVVRPILPWNGKRIGKLP